MTGSSETQVGGWTYEVHELSDGFSAIVYSERGYRVADHLTEATAKQIVDGVNSTALLRRQKEALVEALKRAEKFIAVRSGGGETEFRETLLAALRDAGA